MTPDLTSVKTVVRCRDFAASYRFYGSVLQLPVTEEWDEPQGRGAVFAVAPGGGLEIFEMRPADARYDPAFAASVANDKIDVQLQTRSVDGWAERLRGAWPFSGPHDLPWGHRWITLRDPDGLLLAIYEVVDPS